MAVCSRGSARRGAWGLAVLVCLAPWAGAEEIPYDAVIVWDAPAAVRDASEEEVRGALAAAHGPAASARQMRRRAERDRDYVLTVLRARAHYAAVIDYRIDLETKPARLAYTVTPGPVYTVSAISIAGTDDAPLPGAEALPVRVGAPATAESILEGRDAAVRWLRERGRPFAALVHQEVRVDHGVRQVSLTYTLEAGPMARYGPTLVSGLENVAAAAVLKESPWSEGDVFDARQIAEYQTRLYRTDLFSVVRVRHAELAGPDGTLPITVEVQERKHRTVAVGLEFHTDFGPGGRVQWEDRNRRGLGYRWDVSGAFTPIEQRLSTGYRIRRFARPDQDLRATVSLGREDTDAYDSTSLDARAVIERRVTPQLTLSGGAGLRWSHVKQEDVSGGFQLLYAPFEASYDRGNDALDPTSGYRLVGRATPFLALNDIGSVFLKSDVVFTHYQPMDGERLWVLATRARAGSIMGEGLPGVPPDVRFFAGGGGSIRGFAYQLAGPLNRKDEPTGGRSILEASLEVRRRISPSIGIAAFVDAGTVYPSILPDFSETLRYAAGAGLRYYTPLGPFRVDVAVPLNKRSIDDSFQFYLSIGQAF